MGSQCIVVSIEAKRIGTRNWEAYSHNGRQKTGKDALEWAKEAEQLGAGEILVTSIDSEGTMKGFDTQLVEEICKSVTIPVIASGGAGTVSHVLTLADQVLPDAICCASIFHFDKMSLFDLKSELQQAGMTVRL